MPRWCTLHVWLNYGPFCLNMFFCLPQNLPYSWLVTLKSIFSLNIHVTRWRWGQYLAKKLNFGVPSKKNLVPSGKQRKPFIWNIRSGGFVERWFSRRADYLVFKVTFVELDMRALIERVCWWKYKFWWARWRRVRALQTLKFTRFAARFSETPSRYCLCTQGPNQTPRTCLGIPHTSKCCMSKNILKVPPKWDADCTHFMNFTILVAWFSKISSRYGIYTPRQLVLLPPCKTGRATDVSFAIGTAGNEFRIGWEIVYLW